MNIFITTNDVIRNLGRAPTSLGPNFSDEEVLGKRSKLICNLAKFLYFIKILSVQNRTYMLLVDKTLGMYPIGASRANPFELGASTGGGATNRQNRGGVISVIRTTKRINK